MTLEDHNFMNASPFSPILSLYMLNWNTNFQFMYIELNLNWVLWGNSQIYCCYTGYGEPIILVHHILCTKLIGVNMIDMDENGDRNELLFEVIIFIVSYYNIHNLSICDRNIALLVLCLLIFDFVTQPIILLTFF